MPECWIWLATRQGLNKRTQYELIRYFGTAENVFAASEESLLTLSGITPAAMASLNDKCLDRAKQILQFCSRKDIRLLTVQDPDYPQHLLGIQDPPVLLFCCGTVPHWEEKPVIGAVGTRQCSEYGSRTAERLGCQISQCGGRVVSGMAEGIDTAILNGVLAAGGTPVVFLAGGVDVIYPAGNRELYQRILSCGGCVLSEQPPGVKPSKWLFPQRNRLISGISNAVLVVEAPERSGALITARHAMEQGRQVYAVPGPVDAESCRGSNALLKDGAGMAENGWDLVKAYKDDYQAVQDRTGENTPILRNNPKLPRPGRKVGHFPPKEKKVIDNSGQPPYIDVEKQPAARSRQEQAIIDQLASGPRLTDEIINGCGLPRGEALAVMTVLEIGGVLRRLPGDLMVLNER